MFTLTSCAVSYTIYSDTVSNINFHKYKTYAIIHDDHGFEIGTNPINKKRIDTAIDAEVLGLGYKYSENPDLYISWFIKVDTKLEQGVYNSYYNKWRSPRAIEVYEYQEGSLVIDIVDSYSEEVIWHVNVSSKINEEIPNLEQNIKQVVKDVFKSYRKDTGI